MTTDIAYKQSYNLISISFIIGQIPHNRKNKDDGYVLWEVSGLYCSMVKERNINKPIMGILGGGQNVKMLLCLIVISTK